MQQTAVYNITMNNDEFNTDDVAQDEEHTVEPISNEVDVVGQVDADEAYSFLPDNVRRDDHQYGYEQHSSAWWGLGEHSEGTTDWDKVYEDLSDLQEQVPDGLADLLESAEQQAERMENRGFECGVCGLSHPHSSRKHDVRDFFGVTDEFADNMHFNPYCHCGVNELARLMNYTDSIQQQIFEHEDGPDFDLNHIKQQIRNGAGKAPIRNETERELRSTLGPV
jgi:hypothetical protein